LVQANLKLKASKCELFRLEVHVFGVHCVQQRYRSKSRKNQSQELFFYQIGPGQLETESKQVRVISFRSACVWGTLCPATVS